MTNDPKQGNQGDSSLQRKQVPILWLILASLGLHGLWLWSLEHLPQERKTKTEWQTPVTLHLKPKASPDSVPRKDPKQAKEKAPNSSPQQKTIVEAPLLPTEAPDKPAHLGAQDHKTDRETKVQPRNSKKAADASPIQNGPLKLRFEASPEGSLAVPSGRSLREHLPKEIKIVNEAHNDYIEDQNLPVGAVLDVNTTNFRFIGYFTSVRKSVDLAFYDIGPTLRDKDYIRDKIENLGKAQLQGTSVVQLTVAHSGVLLETKLVSSSGDKDVDEFWLRVLNLSAPYPPLPRDFPEKELRFTYKLHYDFVMQGERKAKRFMF